MDPITRCSLIAAAAAAVLYTTRIQYDHDQAALAAVTDTRIAAHVLPKRLATEQTRRQLPPAVQ